MKEDEEIFKKMKIPWMPEGMQPIVEGKCIDSEKENLQRSIKQYKHQIEYVHETDEGLVTANKRLREDLEEVNSHYQELISETDREPVYRIKTNYSRANTLE